MRARALLSFAFLVLLVGSSSVACKRRSINRTSPSSVALTQSYSTENGLVTAHYPADFAAKKLSANSIILARNLQDGTDEAIAFTAVAKPISDDLNEYARVVLNAEVKGLKSYTETSKKQSTCGAGHPSIETVGRWGESPTLKYERHSCIFLANGHGYSIGFSAPERHSAEEVPLLQRIRESVETR